MIFRTEFFSVHYLSIFVKTLSLAAINSLWEGKSSALTDHNICISFLAWVGTTKFPSAIWISFLAYDFGRYSWHMRSVQNFFQYDSHYIFLAQLNPVYFPNIYLTSIHSHKLQLNLKIAHVLIAWMKFGLPLSPTSSGFCFLCFTILFFPLLLTYIAARHLLYILCQKRQKPIHLLEGLYRVIRLSMRKSKVFWRVKF
jgi:hypothetical protein